MLKTLRSEKSNVVDVDFNAEVEYSEHCRIADERTRPLRDCITYYNGHGEAKAGSLAYYGGGQWHKIRERAQNSLSPFKFERKG
jgi:hypothetical protein